jgi:hypothetical protein
MEALSKSFNVEFSLVYKLGPGPDGAGGTYKLYSGSYGRVFVPKDEAGVIWISHTHPSGSGWASVSDQSILKQIIP